MKRSAILLLILFILSSCGQDLWNIANESQTIAPSTTDTQNTDDVLGTPDITVLTPFLYKNAESGDDIHLGPAIQNQNNLYNITIKNRGDKALEISLITLDGGDPYFSFNGLGELTIEVGKSHSFDITFNPVDEQEIITDLMINSNDPDQPTYQLKIRSLGVTGISYVSKDLGVNGNGSAESPYNSIAFAISNALPGYAICIDKDTYNETLFINKSLLLIGSYNYEGGVWTLYPVEDQSYNPLIAGNAIASTTIDIDASTITTPTVLIALNIAHSGGAGPNTAVRVAGNLGASKTLVFENCTIANYNAYSGVSGPSTGIRFESASYAGAIAIEKCNITTMSADNMIGVLVESTSISFNSANFSIRHSSITTADSTITNTKASAITVHSSTGLNMTNSVIDINENSSLTTGSFTSADYAAKVIDFYSTSGTINMTDGTIAIQKNALIAAGNNRSGAAGSCFSTAINIDYTGGSSTNSALVIQNNKNIRTNLDNTSDTIQNTKAVFLNLIGSLKINFFSNKIMATDANSLAIGIEKGEGELIMVNNIVFSQATVTAKAVLITNMANKNDFIYNHFEARATGVDAVALDLQPAAAPGYSNMIINNIIISKGTAANLYGLRGDTNLSFITYLNISYNLFSENIAASTLNAPATDYPTAAAINTLYGLSTNISISGGAIFDSDFRLTSSPVNNPVLSAAFAATTTPDINGNPRPGADGVYAIGPYEY